MKERQRRKAPVLKSRNNSVKQPDITCIETVLIDPIVLI